MEFKTLNSIAIKDILTVFNESFSDYFVSFQLTLDQLAAKMLADKVDLDLSVGVFENEKLIAFILHGVNIINGNKALYNGGTGVVPQKRGHGLTKQMYHFILPVLQENGIHDLILEVISNNIQAR
ncbi:MAG: putative acetyltransferase [Crocinitomix sp.]|jgi:predicted acetyltransferase